MWPEIPADRIFVVFFSILTGRFCPKKKTKQGLLAFVGDDTTPCFVGYF